MRPSGTIRGTFVINDKLFESTTNKNIIFPIQQLSATVVNGDNNNNNNNNNNNKNNNFYIITK